MKKYEPAQMVALSRYRNYFPTLPTEVRQDVYSRMNDLLMEEKEYCDKGNYAHMSQILTSIALYEVLQKRGYSEEEAYRIVSEEMWKFLDPSGMLQLYAVSERGIRKKTRAASCAAASAQQRFLWDQRDPWDVDPLRHLRKQRRM